MKKPVIAYFNTAQMIYAHLCHNDPFLPEIYHEKDGKMKDWDAVYLCFDSFRDCAEFFGVSSAYISKIIHSGEVSWENDKKEIFHGAVSSIYGIYIAYNINYKFNSDIIYRPRTLQYSAWKSERERGDRNIWNTSLRSLWIYNLNQYERRHLRVENGFLKLAETL